MSWYVERPDERQELTEVWAAIRSRAGVVGVVLALSGVAWWLAARQMAGMDTGPGTELGTFGWFCGVWVVMMAAMMLPSLAPTTALYARMTRRRGWSRPLLFTAAYVAVWGTTGLVAYGLAHLGRTALGGELAWSAGGRWAAGGILALAALYEVTPLKRDCLGKCRRPRRFLVSHWRDGHRGALQMGTRHAGWCLGCCWALMAALFALGAMSLTWMGVLAALIALEKMLPWRRVATWAAAGVLAALAVALIAAPHHVPGLVVPGGNHPGMPARHAMP